MRDLKVSKELNWMQCDRSGKQVDIAVRLVSMNVLEGKMLGPGTGT